MAVKVGGSSPWGKIQHVKQVADGVYSVSTAGHGGLKLDAKQNAKMPAALKVAGGWYEEDEAWSLVAIGLPEYFSDEVVAGAEKIVKDWYPDEYEAFTGKVLLPGESSQKDKKAFLAAHANDWLVNSAVGSWHEDCPEGLVLVWAKQNGQNETQFYVPAEEYAARGAHGFVVDPAKHAKFGSALKISA